MINKELKIIKEIATKHGYSRALVDRIYRETLESREKKRQADSERENNDRREPNDQTEGAYQVVPDALRNFRSVSQILRKSKKKSAYKRPKTIFNILRNIKDEYEQENRTGVYQIPLLNLDYQRNEAYIGATTRNLKNRLNEHKRDIRNGALTTALAKRAYEHDVKINWEEAKIIKEIHNMNELKVAEEVQIFLGIGSNKVINDKQSVELSNAWKFALKQ